MPTDHHFRPASHPAIVNSAEHNLVEVYVAANEFDARHLQLLLADHGIRCRIVGTGLLGGSGELPPGWELSPRIWVNAKRADLARTIIDSWETERKNNRQTPAENWSCPQCHSPVPVQFEICWNCRQPAIPD